MTGAATGKVCNVCGYPLSAHVNGKPCSIWQWVATVNRRARGSHD